MNELRVKYKAINECKTFKELYKEIPDTVDCKLSFFSLLGLSIIPMLTMMVIALIKSDADLFLFISFLFWGDMGLLLTVWGLGRIKTTNESLSGKFSFKYHSHHLFLFLILALSLVSSLQAFHVHNAFIGDVYRHEGFLTYLAYAGYYGMGCLLIQPKYRTIVLRVFCGVATLLSILTIIQSLGIEIIFFSKGTGLSAVFYNTNHFAYYLTMAIICCGGLIVIDKIKFNQILYSVCFSLMSIALILNNTFGCYLAVWFGLFLIILIFSLSKGRVVKIAFLPLVIFTLISLGNVSLNQTVMKNFNVLSNDVTSILEHKEDTSNWISTAGSGRWSLWMHAIDFIKEKPLLGYGPDNLYYEYQKVGVDMDRPHNEYLQHAAQLGIPSLIFYLCALASIYIKAFIHRKTLTPTTLVALCAVGAYLFSALFGNTMFYTTPYFMMLLGMATKISKRPELNNQE